MTDRERIEQLEEEVRRAYGTLGEVTSRLLLVNEAADAIFGTHDRTELADRFLDVVARACEAKSAALFIHDGAHVLLGGTLGLDQGERAALLESAEAVANCDQALSQNANLIVDPDMGPEGVEEAVVEGAEEEVPAVGDEEAEAEAPAAEAEEAGAEETGANAEASADTAGEEEAAEEEAEPEESTPAPEFGIYMPVLLDEQPVAVLALGPRARGRRYSQEDLTFLEHLLEQLAVAVSRIVLMERNQERLEELDALLRVSREITSTLDLDAVLRGVVNTAGAVVENDRCELALFDGGKLRLRAVSGLTRVGPDAVESYRLKEVLDWLSLNKQRIQVAAEELADEEAEVPGADVFRAYFSSQQMSAFMALPLKDDQGLLGFLCLESRQQSWDLEPGEGDALDILAGQTTVAVRNAMLYGQVPMRKVAAPLMGARARFGRMSAERRRLTLAVAAGALVLAALPILPRRASGPCEVLPARLHTLRAETDVVVREVLARGGETVRAGQVLALLEDPDLSARVSRLQGELQAARVEASLAQQKGDLLGHRLKQLEAEDLARRLAFEQERSRRRRLAAPAAGQILELNLEEQVGRYLEAGDAFCQVSDLGRMRAEILVAEDQIARVRPGASVQLKVVSYPTRTFRGKVSEVAWAADPGSGRRPGYRVRVEVANPDLALRPGMTGQGKVAAGRETVLGMLAFPIARQVLLAFW